jgi:hypothetical protein
MYISNIYEKARATSNEKKVHQHFFVGGEEPVHLDPKSFRLWKVLKGIGENDHIKVAVEKRQRLGQVAHKITLLV